MHACRGRFKLQPKNLNQNCCSEWEKGTQNCSRYLEKKSKQRKLFIIGSYLCTGFEKCVWMALNQLGCEDFGDDVLKLVFISLVQKI